MCIIIAKHAGSRMPAEDILRAAWRANPDGGGIMYADAGKVHIVKGLMTFNNFAEQLRIICAGRDVEAMAIVMHMRIATHGGVRPDLTHPWPLCSSGRQLRRLHSTAARGVAHNGILHGMQPCKTESDTLVWVRDQLAPLDAAAPGWLHTDGLLSLVHRALGDDRLAVLDGQTQQVTLLGDWIEDDGVSYSNASYLPRMLGDDATTQTRLLQPLPPGAYVVDAGGMWDGDAYMDAAGRLYEWDGDAGYAWPADGAAYSAAGTPVHWDAAAPHEWAEVVA